MVYTLLSFRSEISTFAEYFGGFSLNILIRKLSVDFSHFRPLFVLFFNQVPVFLMYLQLTKEITNCSKQKVNIEYVSMHSCYLTGLCMSAIYISIFSFDIFQGNIY